MTFIVNAINPTLKCLFIRRCRIYFDQPLYDSVLFQLAFQDIVVFFRRMWYQSIKSSRARSDDLWWLCSDERGCFEVYNKQPVVTDTISRRHNTSACDEEIGCCPNPIDRSLPAKIRRSNCFASKFTNYFIHV